MTFFKKIGDTFLEMPLREKILVSVLAAIFLFFFGRWIISELRFPLPQEKGIFTEGMVGNIKTLNPLYIDFNDTDRDFSQLIFSGLIRYDPAKKNFFPDLAENWERTKDGRTYTVTLRTGVLWHDGKPFTADDVFFTFHDVIQDPGFRNQIIKSTFEGVEIKKIEPSTIAFILPKANSYFISHLTVGILPKHLLENTPIATLEKSSFSTHPIGTGPYRVHGLKLDPEGDSIDLVMFKEYYGIKPTIPRIRFFTFPDEKSLIQERSSLHAMSKLKEISAVSSISTDPRFAIYPYTLNQFTALVFNTEHTFLKDKKIRKALQLSLNKNELILQGEQRIDFLNLAMYEKNPLFAANPEMASKIFENFGWRIGAGGFRKNNKGEIISLSLLVNSKISKEIPEKIRNFWQNMGIQVSIETLEGEAFFRKVSERRYAVLLIRHSLGYNRDVYPLFHSSQTGETGLNFSNFKSFQTDGLTEAIRKEKNPPDKEKLLGELSKVIVEEVPMVFLSTPVYAYALDKRAEPFIVDHLDFHSDRLSILPYLHFPFL